MATIFIFYFQHEHLPTFAKCLTLYTTAPKIVKKKIFKLRMTFVEKQQNKFKFFTKSVSSNCFPMIREKAWFMCIYHKTMTIFQGIPYKADPNVNADVQKKRNLYENSMHELKLKLKYSTFINSRVMISNSKIGL